MDPFISGILITVGSGLVMGTSPWPLKLMKQYRYEQFAFVSMLTALVVIPWAITLTFCPDFWAALGQVSPKTLITANLFSLSWGIAQVLAMLCFIRIGVSLTYGILCSIGAAVGVVTPMVFKASGVFSNAPNILSRTGAVVIAGVVVMVGGVVLASLAGFGREKQKANSTPDNSSDEQRKTGNFMVGLIMVIASGILSAGWGFAFSYSQDAIITAVRSHGAAAFPASIAVWAAVLPGAAAVNVLYPAYLLTRKGTWRKLANGKEFGLALVYGLLFFIPSPLLGKGMLQLGALGASVGWGIVQGTLILGGQLLGFVSGEWRGVTGQPRRRIYAAILVLIVAMVVLAYANWLASR